MRCEKCKHIQQREHGMLAGIYFAYTCFDCRNKFTKFLYTQNLWKQNVILDYKIKAYISGRKDLYITDLVNEKFVIELQLHQICENWIKENCA